MAAVSENVRDELAANVERGARLLDEHDPLWWLSIDPAALEMADCSRCIIGQLFGVDDNLTGSSTYFEATKVLFGHDVVSWATAEQEVAHGFDLACPYESVEGAWDLLRDLWVDAVKERAAS